MKILALEPYYGGSHQAFLDGWSKYSKHTWTVFSLPPHSWKWRMHHAAVTFAERAEAAVREGERWDAVVCSSMLDLAAFVGLAPPEVQACPRVLYFHENQLTYPLPEGRLPDYHYAFIHLTSGASADAVWFNSHFHQDEFYEALTDWIKSMPNEQPLNAVKRMRGKSSVRPQGLEPVEAGGERRPGPLRILWAARWEYDKNAEAFFEALDMVQEAGVDFQISVIGQQFRRVPEVFTHAHERWKDQIIHWGYLPSREAYLAALQEADIAVSTALHEFFGIGIAEAAAAGAFPLVPNRLSYPEVFCRDQSPEFFYEGTPRDLADKIIDMSRSSSLQQHQARELVTRFFWPCLAPKLDAALADLTPSQRTMTGGNAGPGGP